MNQRIRELADQAGIEINPCDTSGRAVIEDYTPEERLADFARLIVAECMDNLAWHGQDEAVSQLNWFKINKLGIKE